MAVNYSAAQRMIGKPCVARCRDGSQHVGVVRRVTNEGIYMQRMQGGLMSGKADQTNVTTADRPHDMEADNVFWPLLFLPFLTLAALSPWGWGGYGYGYGGYGRYGGYWW